MCDDDDVVSTSFLSILLGSAVINSLLLLNVVVSLAVVVVDDSIYLFPTPITRYVYSALLLRIIPICSVLIITSIVITGNTPLIYVKAITHTRHNNHCIVTLSRYQISSCELIS